jgi:hypothetical protein
LWKHRIKLILLKNYQLFSKEHVLRLYEKTTQYAIGTGYAGVGEVYIGNTLYQGRNVTKPPQFNESQATIGPVP